MSRVIALLILPKVRPREAQHLGERGGGGEKHLTLLTETLHTCIAGIISGLKKHQK